MCFTGQCPFEDYFGGCHRGSEPCPMNEDPDTIAIEDEDDDEE